MARTILQSKRRVYLALAGVALLALIVVGTAYAITSGSFKYSSTKTAYISVSPMDMGPDSDNTTYFNDWSDGLADSGGGCFNAGVNLPQGAKIKSITYAYISGAGSNFFGRFVRMNLNNGNGVDIIDPADPVNDAGTPAKVKRDVTGSQQNVDNNTYAYGVGVCPGSDGTFLGAKIKYTYKTAGA